MRKSRSSQVLAATTAAAAIAALAFTSDASAVTAPPSSGAQSSQGTETVDGGVGALVKPPQAQAAAVAPIVKASRGPRAPWDGRFGTVRPLPPAIGHPLSGPRSGTAVDVARA